MQRLGNLVRRLGSVPRAVVALLHQDDYALLAFASFLFFFLEVVLFSGLRFVTGYFEAHLVIALGLLGLLAGGTLAALLRDEHAERLRLAGTLGLVASPLVGFGGVLIAQPHFWIAAALLLVAFVPVGVLIGLLYRTVEPHAAYALELLFGVVGFVASLLSLRYLREESALVLAMVATLLFVLWYLRTVRSVLVRTSLWVLLTLSLTLFATNLSHDFLNLIETARCDLSQPGASSKVICFKEVPFAYAPVRSLGSVVARVDVLALLTTGGPMLITSFAGDQNDAIQAAPPEVYERDARVPETGALGDALVIGAGAEGVAKAVRAKSFKRITALELNGTITALWKQDKELNAYARHPFRDVELIAVDGRTQLTLTEQQFDLITLMNTHRSRGAGALGEPDFLHTREAFELMYERLSESGTLVIEERIEGEESIVSIERILATLRVALQRAGVEHPEAHIALYTWASALPADGVASSTSERVGNFFQIVVQKAPVDGTARERLLIWAQESARTDGRTLPTNAVFSEWVYLPGGKTGEERGEERGADAALPARFIDALFGRTALETISDDRPFTLRLDEAVFGTASGTAIVLSAVLVGALVWYVARARDRGRVPGRNTSPLLLAFFFVLIGLGYIGIELFFLGVFQRTLGSVLLSLVASIAGMLVASALAGALVRTRTLPPALWLLAPALAALALYGATLLPHMAIASLSVRFILAFALAGLAGLALGPFFPHGVAWARETYRRELPLLVGINGSALALGVPLALLAMVTWGFTTLAVLCVLFYIAAVAVRTFAP